MVFWGSAALGQADCDGQSVFLRKPDSAPDNAIVRFSVEIADDAAERAQGLMNRESMAASSAMLFVYDAPQSVSFWMKNTLIPLDLLFIDAAGQVKAVHPMAKPLDTTPIPGGEAIQYVLEINGGLAGQLGLGPGSVLRHPSIDQTLAIWPCAAQ